MSEILESVRSLIAPILVIVLGMATLLLDLGQPTRARHRLIGWLTAVVLLAIFAVSLFPAVAISDDNSPTSLRMAPGGVGGNTLFGAGMVADPFSAILDAILVLVAGGALKMSSRLLRERNLPVGEYYALILFAAAGAMLMAHSIDLVNVFVSLEVLSVALYILAGYLRRDLRSEESAVKYFLLGAFSSGFLLYGIALVYGAVGFAAKASETGVAKLSLTSFETIGYLARVPDSGLLSSPLFAVGVLLILVGLGFKASLVPFHAYAPDVYQGAPSPVAAFMSAAAKIGAFAVLIRLLQAVAPPDSGHNLFYNVLWGIALATMLVGNILAVRQTNLKRMLAYSSIAHAGYILVGTLATTKPPVLGFALDSLAFYFLIYAITNIGAFATLVWLGRNGEELTDIRDFTGLGKRQPVAAAIFSIFLLSLAGIPPAAGFLAKLYVFLAAIRGEMFVLATLGLVISVIGVFYYLNVIVSMYFREPIRDIPEGRGGGARVTAVVCALALLVLGVIPTALIGPTSPLRSGPAPLAPTARPGDGRPSAPQPDGPAPTQPTRGAPPVQ